MIVLNFGSPISDAQKAQIIETLVVQLDPRFNAPPELQVIDVETLDSAKATLDAVDCDWAHVPVAHRIPESNPIRDALLYEIEKRAGYSHVEIRGKR